MRLIRKNSTPISRLAVAVALGSGCRADKLFQLYKKIAVKSPDLKPYTECCSVSQIIRILVLKNLFPKDVSSPWSGEVVYLLRPRRQAHGQRQDGDARGAVGIVLDLDLGRVVTPPGGGRRRGGERVRRVRPGRNNLRHDGGTIRFPASRIRDGCDGAGER